MNDEPSKIAWRKAEELVENMGNEQLLACWNSICKGGLGNVTYVNDIPSKHWVELVHSELTVRQLFTRDKE